MVYTHLKLKFAEDVDIANFTNAVNGDIIVATFGSDGIQYDKTNSLSFEK